MDAPPSGAELSGLVEGLLEEELLAREAEALGLGENDTVVRRRLAQKLAFLVDDTVRLAEPTEAELRQFHAAHPDRFRAAGRVSFRQIYFNPEQRPHAEADAKTALLRISSSDEVMTQDVGDRLLLETEFRDLDEQTVSNMFGPDFAGAVFALEPGAWRGPLKSGYGLHLVRLTSTSPGASLPFEEVRIKVIEEWRRQRERETKAAYLAKLREKYGVVLDDSVKALLPPGMGTMP